MSEENITRITLKEALKTRGKTDWEKLARSNPDDDAEDDFDWSRAEIIEPVCKQAISLRIDPEVLTYFKSGGAGYQTRINAVLKAYVRAQQPTAPAEN